MASSKPCRDLVKQSYSSLLCGQFLWAPPSLSFATQSLLTVVPTVQSIYFWNISSWPNGFFSKVSAFIWFGLLLGDIVAWIRLQGEIWHRGEAVSYHPVPPQMAGQQAHQFTLVCQRPVVQSFVCAYKRDQRELSEVSTVSPVVSLGPLNRLALFFD